MKEYQEKINIYVPHEAGKRLDNDAQLFEIFKADQRSINKNRFLTMLLCGYYDEYLQERKALQDAVLRILDDSGVSVGNEKILSEAIVDEVYDLDIPKRKGKDSVCFSFKPTKESERIIMDIKHHPSERGYPSQFFCKMLISYLKKPISVRERIIFKNSVEIIDSACASGRAITFSSIWDKTQWHEVMPFALVPSQEEMYNYLVCEEVNTKTGLAEVRSYRLNRMTNVGFGARSQPISTENKLCCERTVRIAPQYAINSDEEICVRLNAAGAKLYNRIYYGRPPFERIEPLADGSGYYYYFRCSPDQVFHYFRRFDNDTAQIISPTHLRKRIKEFHQGALKSY